MSLRIDGVSWSFQPIHGRQFLNGEQYVAIIHADTRTVTVSDLATPEEQLESTARAALRIRHSAPIKACALGWERENFDQRQALRGRRTSP